MATWANASAVLASRESLVLLAIAMTRPAGWKGQMLCQPAFEEGKHRMHPHHLISKTQKSLLTQMGRIIAAAVLAFLLVFLSGSRGQCQTPGGEGNSMSRIGRRPLGTIGDSELRIILQTDPRGFCEETFEVHGILATPSRWGNLR